MMFGLMRVRTHDAEMAKVRGEQRTTGAALREALDECEFQTLQAETNAVLLSRAHETIDTLQARLDALTPARRKDGRFAAKAQRLQPASPPASIAGHGLEDFA